MLSAIKIFKILFFSLLIFSAPIYADPHRAVMLIDMQIDFLKNQPLEIVEPLVKRQIDLLHWAREQGDAVFIFEYVNSDETLSALNEVASTFQRKAWFIKYHDSAFRENLSLGKYPWMMPLLNNMAQKPDGSHIKSYQPYLQMKAWGINTVIVGGVNGNACVKHSVVDLLAINIQVLTAADIVANVNEEKEYPSGHSWWLTIPQQYTRKFKTFISTEELTANAD